MNRSQVIFFVVVLTVVIAIARHNSRTTAITPSGTPSPPHSSALVPASTATPLTAPPPPVPSKTAELSQNQSAELRKVTAKITPAMVLISIFDSSGRLLRNGTGFFVSEDGRLVTSQSVVEGGAHAVAKTRDGRIHNISGILASGGTSDVVVLKAQPKKPVAFLRLSKTAPDNDAAIAVIGNPLTGRDPVLAQSKIAKKQSDQNGEFFELSSPVPNELGSAAVNENGEVVGIISQSAKGNALRSATVLNSLLAQIDSGAKVGWQVASLRNSEAPPAEGPPLRKTKIPLAGTEPVGNSRLIYTPAPGYPKTASHSSRPLKGSGRFRITFSRNGEVKDVGILESTRDPALDNAALDALRRWKARPGQEWTANVPVSFQP